MIIEFIIKGGTLLLSIIPPIPWYAPMRKNFSLKNKGKQIFFEKSQFFLKLWSYYAIGLAFESRRPI